MVDQMIPGIRWRRLCGTFLIGLALAAVKAIIEHRALFGLPTYGLFEYINGFIVAARHWPSPTPSSEGRYG